mmetsp:Transcript_18911/g.47236  ORF Transcript_18911/g.47236 Transcript_18911/m.47236 type:complete len:219 (-) Transcript_18911:300-956(-)
MRNATVLAFRARTQPLCREMVVEQRFLPVQRGLRLCSQKLTLPAPSIATRSSPCLLEAPHSSWTRRPCRLLCTMTHSRQQEKQNCYPRTMRRLLAPGRRSRSPTSCVRAVPQPLLARVPLPECSLYFYPRCRYSRPQPEHCGSCNRIRSSVVDAPRPLPSVFLLLAAATANSRKAPFRVPPLCGSARRTLRLFSSPNAPHSPPSAVRGRASPRHPRCR